MERALNQPVGKDIYDLWYTWYNYPQGPTFTAAAPRYLQAQHLQNPAAVALGVKGRSTKRLEDSQ